MTCSTDIVDCLKKKGVEPRPFASSEESDLPASNALFPEKIIYRSLSLSESQWWAIAFNHRVSIRGYQMESRAPSTDNCRLKEWTLSVSDNNKTWLKIHGPVQYEEQIKSYYFVKKSASYARIDGKSLSSADNTVICFGSIKFFGSIPKTDSLLDATYSFQNSINKSVFLLIFMCVS